jgi:hypothetical protein
MQGSSVAPRGSDPGPGSLVGHSGEPREASVARPSRHAVAPSTGHRTLMRPAAVLSPTARAL